MRETFIKGLNDNFDLSLGSNTDLVFAVMQIGKAEDAITFSAEMTGAELKKFIEKYARKYIERIDEIKSDNRYKITAYDW